MSDVGFHWDGDHLRAELPHGARALFSTRRGGVSEGPYASLNLGRTSADQETDDPARVAANRARLADAAGGARLRLARQVHGADIATDDDPRAAADGQVTRERGVGATVLVADCLPVVVAGPDGVASLHAGWRGLAAGVLQRGVQALVAPGEQAGGVDAGREPGGPGAEPAGEPGAARQLGGGAERIGASGSPRLAAAIGPHIRACCFEVGDEVRAAFADHPDARRGRHLDLAAIARRTLLNAGVDEVADCGRCTHCEPELFFSHRRDGAETGRQAGVAWRS